MKAHLKYKHTNFLEFRATKFKTNDLSKVCDDTYKNHINSKFPWPTGLLSEFEEKQGSLKKFIEKDGHKIKKSSNDEDDVDMKSKDEIMDEENEMENLIENEKHEKVIIEQNKELPVKVIDEEKKEKVVVEQNKERPEKVIDEQKNELKNPEIKREIDDNINVYQGEKVLKENIASTEKIRINEVHGENLPNKQRKRKKFQTLLYPETCVVCDRLETLYNCTENHRFNCITECTKHVAECSHKKKSECCCKVKLKTILEKIGNNNDVSGEEDESNGNMDKNDEAEVEANFFYKIKRVKKKKLRLWFCSVCSNHNRTVGKKDKRRGDWHFTGICKEKRYEWIDGMKKHLNSASHKKCKKIAMEEIKEKPFSVYSNKIADKTTENLCITSQFSATNNMTQRFHPKFCRLMEKLNDNLGENIQAKVHPLGNVHHGTMDVKEGMKACYLAIQEKLREEDQTIFPPTNLLPRYTLCYDKGTAVKDSQRQVIVATKICHETGMPVEILVSASVLPRGTAEGVLEHITTETKKFLTTERIGYTCSDNEPVYVGNISGAGIRMLHNPNYSPLIIHFPDTSHNAEKIATPPQKKI